MVWRRAIFTTASLWLALAVAPFAAGASNSWLIDAARFHLSAHRQLSCATCHDSVANNAAHPDPHNVKQPPARSDPAEGCWVCHDAVRAGVAQGQHGGMTGQDAFFFPPDPSSGKVCTMGGTVGTNAGGVKGAKYGTTRDYVLGLEWCWPMAASCAPAARPSRTSRATI